MTEETKALTVYGKVDLSNYFDKGKFDQIHNVAKMFAQARLIPKHYQGSVPDCVIAISRASNMGLDPIQFMEKTYVVGGKIGLESQLCVALTNKSGIFKDVIDFKFSGKDDALTCTAFAFTAATGIKCEAKCSVQNAKDMGWWGRNGSPWPKQTGQMLRYRSATRLIKTYCPEVLMGLDSVDELRDYEGTRPQEKNITQEVNELREDKPDFQPPPARKKAEKKPPKEKPEKEANDPAENQDAKPELHPDVAELKELYENPVHAEDFAKLDRQEIEYTIANNRATSAAKFIEEAKIGG